MGHAQLVLSVYNEDEVTGQVFVGSKVKWLSSRAIQWCNITNWDSVKDKMRLPGACIVIATD